MLLHTHTFTFINHLAIWGSIVIFFVVNDVVSNIRAFGVYEVAGMSFREPWYWLSLMIVGLLAAAPVFAWKLTFMFWRLAPDTISIMDLESPMILRVPPSNTLSQPQLNR